MKPLNFGIFYKFVCFVLIVILTISVASFAANGWQTDKLPESGEVDTNNDKADENQDGNHNTDHPGDDSVPDNDKLGDDTSDDSQNLIPEKPIYYNKITGLEASIDEINALPMGVVLDPTAPLYGVSSCDLLIEFPIEDGTSRIVAYTTSLNTLWKLGSLKPSRNYISNSSNFFGGIIVCYGKDDIVSYNPWDSLEIELDLSKITNSYYIENTLYIYTSTNLISQAISNVKVPESNLTYKDPPYNFSDVTLSGTTFCQTVNIPYSQRNQSEFFYHPESEKYIYYKSGNRKIDMLTGKNLSFDNLFILFSDATTYEFSEGSELVVDTMAGGVGYYISKGYMTEFVWSTDKSGALNFKSLSGHMLTVNRGTAYIAYYKASIANNVILN